MGWGRAVAAACAAAVLSACTAHAGTVTSPGASRSPLPAASLPAVSRPADLRLSDFVALDASFVSDDRGFVLGRASCAGAPCVVLLGTTDGARHWTPVSRLPVAPYDDSGGCRVDRRCVQHVRFATALVGYAFGPALYLTRDGGHTWRHLRGWTQALEASATSVLRIRPTHEPCSGDDSWLETARPGGTTWRQVSVFRGPTCPPALYLQGRSTVAVVQYGSPVGTAPWAATWVSRDAGRHVTSVDDACTGDHGHATSVALAPGSTVAQLCVGQSATSRDGDTWLRLSTDLGRSFAPARRIAPGDPSAQVTATLAAASATHLLVLLSGAHVGQLLVTFDGGRTWAMTQEMPPGLRTLIGFEDDNTARAINGDEIYTTTDGGRSWRIDTLVAEA